MDVSDRKLRRRLRQEQWSPIGDQDAVALYIRKVTDEYLRIHYRGNSTSNARGHRKPEITLPIDFSTMAS
jgi:hypothetical protein